jgi:putative nucleotidyltransferase with HDIG domain
MSMQKMNDYITRNQLQIVKQLANRLEFIQPRIIAKIGEDRLDGFLSQLLGSILELTVMSETITGRDNNQPYLPLFIQQVGEGSLTAWDLLIILGQLKKVIRQQKFAFSLGSKDWETFFDQATGKIMDEFVRYKEANSLRQRKELEILRRLSQIMREGTGVQEILTSISQVLMDNIESRCLIMLMDKTGRELRVRAASGVKHPSFKNIYVNIVREGIGKLVEDKKRSLTAHVNRELKTLYPKLLRDENINYVFSVPLQSSDKLIGAVVFMGESEGKIRLEGIDFLTSIANHIGVIIGKSLLAEDIYENYLYTIKALVAVIDAKDNYTRGHSERVMEYAAIIAKRLGLSEKEIEAIKFAALLHDIGKIGVDDKILRKPGRLTEEEFRAVYSHPEIGVNILNQVEYLRNLVPAVMYHHERFDGEGYPLGMSGLQIPLSARILAVADALDAMTYDRPYRRAFSVEQALRELARCSGTQFDPQIVEALYDSIGKELPEEEKIR